jgi:prevent-host-death family protein
MFYNWCMGEVASRELRNGTRGLLRRVEAGEHVTITVDGRPVAVLAPLSGRARWMSKDEFLRRFTDKQADAGLATELHQLTPDMTDDLPV